MFVPQVQLSEVIDVHPAGPAPPKVSSNPLAKTGMLEVRRLIFLKGREISTHCEPRMRKDQLMSADQKRIIVTESRCHACHVHSFLVYHQSFPEMRIEAMSPGRAARQLANRLESALGMVSDARHREEVRLAIDEARAFVDREGCAHSSCDVHGRPRS